MVLTSSLQPNRRTSFSWSSSFHATSSAMIATLHLCPHIVVVTIIVLSTISINISPCSSFQSTVQLLLGLILSGSCIMIIVTPWFVPTLHSSQIIDMLCMIVPRQIPTSDFNLHALYRLHSMKLSSSSLITRAPSWMCTYLESIL